MRIRKNAKISHLLYTNTGTNLTIDASKPLQNCFCELNQSPWDIITFPPPDSSSPSTHEFDRYEVCYNVNLAANGSSIDYFGPVGSLASMKTSSEGKANHVNHSGNDDDGKAKNDYGLCVKEEEDFEGEREREGGDSEKEEEEEEIVLCSKTDGKGWQCGRVVKKGKKICDHHLAQVQNYGKDKKKSRANVVEKRAQRRPRPKKPEANPYEFYYYSGFGPSWGKKRGIPGGLGQGYKDTVLDGAKGASSTSNASDLCDSSYVNCDKSTTSSSDVRFDGDTKLCYIEYEDDEDEDEDEEEIKVGISGKKRGRKPIKARSLKSLM